MLARCVEHPAALGAGAVDASFLVHLHAVGNAVLGGIHGGEDPVVAQAVVGGHVKGPDKLMLAHLLLLFLFQAPAVPAGDGYIQDALVGREGQAVGILGLRGGQRVDAVRADAVHAAEVQLLFVLREASARVGEIKGPVGTAHHVIGAVDPLPVKMGGDGLVGAVCLTARHLASVALAHDQVALFVEGQAVGPTAGVPVDLQLAAGRHLVYLELPDIDEEPITVGVPQGAFGEPETSGQFLCR